jgi:phosphatidylethanolamine/phosphatidyl-N-methylethanolamine N-methyltransferase
LKGAPRAFVDIRTKEIALPQQPSRSPGHQASGAGKGSAGQPADGLRFLKSWLENPGRTGAVSPSGPGLAREMASRVDLTAEGPIVELGPGTGPVTEALLARGIDPSRMILVEYSEAFCALLEERFAGVKIIRGDAYTLAETLKGTLTSPAAAVV